MKLRTPQKLLASLIALLLLALAPAAWATTVTNTFTSSGTFSCPLGINTISVAVQGGGGAGGRAQGNTGIAGGGGGGGCAFSPALSVTPGNSYTVTVGAGGNAGTEGSGAVDGPPGAPSSFSGSDIVTLTGNGGGGGQGSSDGRAGGTNGTAVGGTFNYSGGAGTNGAPNSGGNTGGGGGGGAGTTSAGVAAAGNNGGAGGTGNPAGGAGSTSTAPTGGKGPTGTAPGGGGSGATYGPGSTSGSSGGKGQVVVTYDVTAPVVTTQVANPTNTTDATLNGTVLDGTSAFTDYGFYWGTTPGVTTSSTQISLYTGDNNGPISTDLSGLSVNTIYYYRAYANNSLGNTLGNSDVSFYTLANTPTTPTVNTPTSSSLHVTLGSGDGNPSSTLYAIYETSTLLYVSAAGALNSATPVYQTAATWNPSGAAKTVTGLGGNTTYTFEVIAENGAGVPTSYSSSASGTTSPGAPAVSTQAASGQTTSSATLNGTVLANGGSVLTKYGFYWSTAPGVSVSSTYAAVGTSDYIGGYTTSLGSLNPNKIYYYRAYAANSSGGALGSADVSFWTLANTPTIPTVNGATANTLRVTLGSGDGNPSSTVYAIYETTTANYVTAAGLLTSSTPVYQTAAAWGTVVVTNLTACVYVFQVVAENGAGVTTDSSPAASGGIIAPAAPTATAATGVGAGTFTANWTAMTGATDYSLDVAYDSGFAVLISGYNNLSVGNVTTKVVTTSNPGTFYYRVRANNCAGTSASSSTITAVVTQGGSIASLPFYDSFSYGASSGGLAALSTPVWINGNGVGSTSLKYNPAPGLIAPAGLYPAANGSAASGGTSPRCEGMRHTTQTAVDGATVYYSFLYKLNNAPTGTANANGLPVEAIVCFNNLVPVGNTDVPDGTAGTILINTNRQIGINQGGGATANGTTAFASTQLAVGQAYLIVARYTFHPAGNDTIDLWVSPASSSFGVSPPTPDVTVTATGTGSSTNIPSLAYFTLYIDPGIGINYVWDEVRIDTTWPGVTPSAPDTITTFSGLTASQSIPYGTASITLGGKVSGTGPVYPPSGDTVAITINGHTVNGTVTDSTGDFSITYNDASLATLPAGSYAIGYQYAGNVGLNYSASPINTSTTLTVSYASPVLAIAVSGPNAIISWPSGADPGFILKSNIDLTSPATWATAGTPVVIGSQRVVTNAVVPSGLFYRLMK